ncbi:MAG: right-handed parallel beta-helix repeat-containing protein [Actinomycetota bacterium]
MKPKPSLIVATWLAMAVAAFGAGLAVGDRREPLPPQPTEEAMGVDGAEMAVAGATADQPVTTAELAVTLGAFVRMDPDPRELPSAERELDAGCDDPVVVQPPAADFAAVVAEAPERTCFLLEPGRYGFHDVRPKDYMTFLGADRSTVVVAGTSETENAFSGTATGVTIGRMTITGFQGSGGAKRQEQGAIRGTIAIWRSDRGQMATHWLIEDIVAADNFATGVLLGDHFTVRNSVLADNGVAGLGGSETVGGLVEGNVVRGNGAQQATGYLGNGGGMKFTQAVSPEDPLVIRGNEVHDNTGIGIWCDIGCDGFHVLDNYIHDQESRAVMFELSSNALIAGNLLVNTNNWTDFSRDFNAAAITIGESSDVVVEDNYIERADAGIIVRQTRRPVYPQEAFLDDYEEITLVADRVHVRRNVLIDTGAMGVSLGRTGRELFPPDADIRFDANIYANPGGVDFWWAGDRFGYAEWQASGRDLGGATEVPPRPSLPLGP